MAELLTEPVFWVAVAFLIFLALVWKPVGRAIGGALDGRARRIKDELDEAVRLREEAQALLARYQRQQTEAIEEAKRIVAQAKDIAGLQAREGGEALERALKHREAQAIDRIARAEQEAIGHVRATAVDLAARAAERVLAEHLDAEKREALTDAAIAELARKLH